VLLMSPTPVSGCWAASVSFPPYTTLVELVGLHGPGWARAQVLLKAHKPLPGWGPISTPPPAFFLSFLGRVVTCFLLDLRNSRACLPPDSFVRSGLYPILGSDENLSCRGQSVLASGTGGGNCFRPDYVDRNTVPRPFRLFSNDGSSFCHPSVPGTGLLLTTGGTGSSTSLVRMWARNRCSPGTSKGRCRRARACVRSTGLHLITEHLSAAVWSFPRYVLSSLVSLYVCLFDSFSF